MMSASATIATANRASVSEQSEEQKMVKKVAVSSFLGNFIEWFDYASYSYFATTIALVFFPSGNHTVAMLQTFGVFALSFVLRPIGALFWGNFGDKKGRKGALAISIMFMSGASFLIGCLPSYAAIGIFAPALLLLLRMVQGFSASGEYAGAATFLGEYAPTKKRGIYCSLIPASTAIGLLVGSTLATVMTASLSSDALTSWGWRIPFLMAGPLGLIVHFIRTKLADSPVYASMTEALDDKQQFASTTKSVSPLRELFQNHFKTLVQLRCLRAQRGRLLHGAHLPADLSERHGWHGCRTVVHHHHHLPGTVCGFGVRHGSHLRHVRTQEGADWCMRGLHRAHRSGLHGAEHRTVLAGADR